MISKLVSEMGVRCSLVTADGAEARQRSGGAAASDTCLGHATTAVEMPNGNRMYRCDEHRGMRSVEYGPVWETVWVEGFGA